MPEVGGKQLANDFVSMMADVRKAIDESKKTVADALAELRTEITKGAADSALAIRKEAAAIPRRSRKPKRSRKKRPKWRTLRRPGAGHNDQPHGELRKGWK